MPANVEAILSDRVCPALNAAGFTDLIFWTKTTLYDWAHESVMRMARKAAGLVATTSQTLVDGTASYALPAATISVIHVAAIGKTLRAANARDLEAKNPDWRSATGATSTHYVRQDQGLATVRIYPTPNSGAIGNLAVTYHKRPDTVTEGAPTLAWPEVLGGYVGLRVIQLARTAETEAKMPEAAAVADQIASVFEQAATKYWGSVQ